MELTVYKVREIVTEYFKLYNYSPKTIIRVCGSLKLFGNFLEKKHNLFDFRNVCEKYYYIYLNYLLKERQLKDISLKGESCILRKVFSILEEEDAILFNPFYYTKPFRADRTVKDKILSEKEINELLGVLDLTRPMQFRDRTLLEVLYGTGIRASELCNLELHDFLREERLLFIRNGKGGKDRLMPLCNSTYKFLDEYVKKIRKKLLKRKRRTHLFLTGKGEKLKAWELRRILRRISNKVSYKKQVSPHIIRHSFATHLLKSGAGIREVQILLGHKSIKSTQIYINLNQKHLKAEYEKYHPLENELFFDVYGREKGALGGKLEKILIIKKKTDIKVQL